MVVNNKYNKLSKDEQFARRFHHLNKDIKHLYSTDEVYKDVKPIKTNNIGKVLKSRFVEFLIENDLIDNYDFVGEPDKREKEEITFLRLWDFLKSLNNTMDKLTQEQQEQYKNLLNYIYVKCLLKQSKFSS